MKWAWFATVPGAVRLKRPARAFRNAIVPREVRRAVTWQNQCGSDVPEARVSLIGICGNLQTLVRGSAIGCAFVCARKRACVRAGRVPGTNTFAKKPKLCSCFRCRNAWRDKCDLPDRQKLARFGHFTVAGGGRISFCVNVESYDSVSGTPGQIRVCALGESLGQIRLKKTHRFLLVLCVRKRGGTNAICLTAEN